MGLILGFVGVVVALSMGDLIVAWFADLMDRG